MDIKQVFNENKNESVLDLNIDTVCCHNKNVRATDVLRLIFQWKRYARLSLAESLSDPLLFIRAVEQVWSITVKSNKLKWN